MVGPEVRIKREAKNRVLNAIYRSNAGYDAQIPDYRVQILGIGVEGHIGFNEAGTSEDSRTHLTKLDDGDR